MLPVVLDEVCTHCSRDFGPLLHTDLLQILQVSGVSMGNMDYYIPTKISSWVWRSEDRLVHSRILRCFLRSHSLVALAVCLGSLSCWKTQLLQNVLPDLSAVLLGLHDAICSLMFSNKPVRPSQNIWIYTEIELHTGGIYF
ncbi:hypothetical protein ATANTOWER_013959 [Ataeniobius toweri]|uniref:Uncharacterized protein n=1 Tax=Ataeniobius toweri TaxID=208326 RepID=A0ABU7AXT1_9TELE|nr:hypothetical protein [Ataeniobius toweri]